MALIVPTTKQLFTQFLTTLESFINQTTPALQKSYNRAIATAQAQIATGHYRYAAEKIKSVLWITATGSDLDKLGEEINLPRKAGAKTVLTATLPATTGTVIPSTVDFMGDANGVRYTLSANKTSVAGVVTLNGLTAEVEGAAGNLIPTQDMLSIGTQIPGATNTATVTAITTVGTDKETDEDYKARGLFEIRATFGGWSASDYKKVSETVSGVRRAFPFSGKPLAMLPAVSYPGDRTIYIESTTDIDPDGIATTALKNAVRARLNTDPDTLLAIQPLGLEDATLYVETISRIPFYITITGFICAADIIAQVKAAIEAAIDQYFDTITMYVAGVTLPQERNDKITDVTLSKVVADVASANGASADTVSFGIDAFSFLPSYTLVMGELAKRGGAIVYA